MLKAICCSRCAAEFYRLDLRFVHDCVLIIRFYYYCTSTLLSTVIGVVVNVCRLSVALWHNFDKEKDYDYTVFNKWLNGTLYCSFGDVKMLKGVTPSETIFNRTTHVVHLTAFEKSSLLGSAEAVISLCGNLSHGYQLDLVI